MKKYWYRFTHLLCPLCFREIIHKERVYVERESGHYTEDSYDHCDDW